MKLYLYLHKPNVVFQAQINQLTTTYPVQNIGYDNVTVGDYTDVTPEMTVLIGSSAGLSDRGRTAVQSIDEDTLTIPKASLGSVDGTVSIFNNEYITILDLYRPRAKIPFINTAGVQYKDGNILASSIDAVTEPPPVANGLPGYAQFVDEDTGLITVDFDANASFALNAATITDYAWDFRDGTPSTSTNVTETVTFPAGFRYIYLTVTDSNSKTHTKRIPILASEKTGDNAPITKFQVKSWSRRIEGQKITLQVDQEILESDYSDGTLAILFWSDAQGNVSSAVGREHIAFIGWMNTEKNSVRMSKMGRVKTVDIELLDIGGKLATLPGFPQTIVRKTGAVEFGQSPTINIDEYLYYLLQWHSNALDLADYYPSGLADDYPLPILGSNGSSLYDQVDKRAQAIVHRFTCNRVGQLKIKPDPQLKDLSDRTTNVNMSLTNPDWGEDGIEFTSVRPPKTHWGNENAIIAQAIDADLVTKIPTAFAVSPGSVPSQGIGSNTIGEQLVVDAVELISRTKHRYQRQNSKYGFFDVNIINSDKMEIDPAEMEWVELTMNGKNKSYRGVELDGTRFLPWEVNYTFQQTKYGVNRQAKVSLELETLGVGAENVVYPEDSSSEIPYESPYDSFPLLNFEPIGDAPFYMFKGTKKIFLISSDGYLYRTSDFDTPESSGGPTWERISLDVSGEVVGAVGDPFCNKYLNLGDEVNGWVITSTGIYFVADLHSTPVGTLQKSFRATSTVRNVQTSFGFAGYIAVSSVYADGVYIVHSEDGSSWSSETLFGVSAADTARGAGIHVDNHIQGLLYSSAFTDATGGYWEQEFDITASNPFDTIEQGTWTAGVGVESVTYFPGDSRHGLSVRLTANPTAFLDTTVIMYYEYEGGTITETGDSWGAVGIQYPFGGSCSRSRADQGDGTSETFDCTSNHAFGQFVLGIQTYYRTSLPAPEHSLGYARLYKVVVAGIGSNPYTGAPGIPGNADGYFSTGNGTSMTRLSSSNLPDMFPDRVLAGDIHVPFESNDVSLIAYYGKQEGAAGVLSLARINGATETIVSPQAGYAPWKSRQIDSSPLNKQRLIVAAGNDDHSSAGIWLTNDEASSWTELVTPTGASGRYDRCALSGDENSVIYVFGEDGAIGYSSDDTNVEDKKGNISSFSPGNIVNIGGW